MYTPVQEAIKQLPGMIKVIVLEVDQCLVLKPVDEKIARLVSLTNEYNGASEVFIQDDWNITEFLADNPKARYCVRKSDSEARYNIGKRWYTINDGKRFMIDSWTFRHYVGGQSD